MKKFLVLFLAFSFALSACLPAFAQDPAPQQQPSADDAAKQKAELEKNAYRLLEQVIDEAQSLRLPDNRLRVQINAADLLWDHNQERARSLFAQASDSVNEMARSNAPVQNNQRGIPQDRRAFALRQELVLAAARHDAPLAYQLLAATKTPVQNPVTDARDPRQQFNAEDNLEQQLLSRIASIDPKFAAQNAEQMMDKGQFPRSLGEVINQLYKQDPEAAAKLADKTVKRIQAANLLSNNDASSLAQQLVSSGPRLPANTSTATDTKPSTSRGPLLDLSPYTDLLSSIIDAALKATPQAQTAQRAQQQRGPGGGIANRGLNQAQPNAPAQPTDAQIEQNNARRLLTGLQSSLPSIDQYLPARANAVRQKLTELGIAPDPNRQNLVQAMMSMQQGTATAESLVQAAATAPAQLQPRLYQQAAARAIDEGNTDRARQIANEHLQPTARDAIMQRIDFREMAKKAEGMRLDEIRQTVARLTSDSDKIALLLQLANDLHKDNPKAELQLLDEARQVVSHRAANYDQFEDQLRVARAFSAVDTSRSFEVIEPGIIQLNELLSAAAVLSGFEVNVFRDGEMTMSNQGGGGGGLTATVSRYGQELASLARSDFGRAETLAGRFQFSESRIMARMAIVQGALGAQPNQPNMGFRNLGFLPMGRPN